MSSDFYISNGPLCRLVDILELLYPRNSDSLHCVNKENNFVSSLSDSHVSCYSLLMWEVKINFGRKYEGMPKFVELTKFAKSPYRVHKENAKRGIPL